MCVARGEESFFKTINCVPMRNDGREIVLGSFVPYVTIAKKHRFVRSKFLLNLLFKGPKSFCCLLIWCPAGLPSNLFDQFKRGREPPVPGRSKAIHVIACSYRFGMHCDSAA